MLPAFAAIIECPTPLLNVRFVDSQVDIPNKQYVRFFLKGTSDGNLGLSTEPLCTGSCYYIVVGGWNNQKSRIRYEQLISCSYTLLSSISVTKCYTVRGDCLFSSLANIQWFDSQQWEFVGALGKFSLSHRTCQQATVKVDGWYIN